MKYFFILILLASFITIKANKQLVTSPSLKCDTVKLDRVDIEKYNSAYKYIISDTLFPGKRIKISDKLIDTCYSLFTKELWGNYSYSKAYQEAYNLDEKRKALDCFHIDFNEILKPENTYKPEYIMSFSKIIENDLFIEIELAQGFGTPFGDSIIYLFQFNPDGTIKQIYRIGLYKL